MVHFFKYSADSREYSGIVFPSNICCVMLLSVRKWDNRVEV